MNRFQHCSERELSMATAGPAGRHIAGGLKACCFSSSKSSTDTSTADQRVVASDGATGQSGSGNQQNSGGAVATGGPSSPIVAGSNVSNVSGGVTITSSDTAALEKGLEAIGDLAGGFGGSLTQVLDTINKSNEAGLNTQQANLSSVLGSIADLSQSKQTDGASAVNKNILYIVLGLFAVMGLGLYFFRRR